MILEESHGGEGWSSLTDNWLLQEVYELISAKQDPSDFVYCLDFHGSSLIMREISKGAIQLLSLFNLIEQIVLSRAIYVHGGFWSTGWYKRESNLNFLVNEGLILGTALPNNEKFREDEYLNKLCQYPPLKKLNSKIPTGWKHSIIGTIVQGSAKYLAISEVQDRVYCPHPLRGTFLQKSLYYSRRPCAPADRFREMVTNTRIKLTEATFGRAKLTKLSYLVSPVVLLCLKESAGLTDPLKVAWQVRHEKEVSNLRRTLNEMSNALLSDSTEKYRSLSTRLEVAIREVERRLRLRDLTSADGPSVANVFSLPLSIPNSLRMPLMPPKHISIISELVKTGTHEVEDIISKALGIRSKKILEDLIAISQAEKGAEE